MTRTNIFDVLKSNMRAVLFGLGEMNITEQSSLVKDFGADSLQVVEIVSRTMRVANAKVKRTDLSKATNIGQLLDLLCGGIVE